MGRPSKLDDRQWSEIGRRLAGGETAAALAREFKVSRPAIVQRFSNRVQEIRNAAVALANAEVVVERMPVSDAASVRALADQLKGVSSSLAKSAASGARVSERLSDLADRFAQRIAKRADEEGTLMPEELKPVAALVETANRASTIGMGLLAANKGKGGDSASTLEDLVTGRASGE